MPFFSDYGYYHGSAPFSSKYYSQLLPYPGSSSSRPGILSSSSRIQPRNYSVEQTLRAIKRGGPAAAAVRQQYSRPVHINTSEIDVTSPRRPPLKPSVTETAVTDDGGNFGGGIQRGRTVIRLHTKNKRTEKPVVVPTVVEDGLEVIKDGLEVIKTVVTGPPPESPTSTMPEEGLAKKGTIKRHTSIGVKVPVTDDRRPSVTDQILREQEALFDTMIMEEMEGGQRERRKSYPVDTDDSKKQLLKHGKDTRKKSAAAIFSFGGEPPALAGTEKSVTKKAGTNWKMNYDVIVEESVGTEPVSFTFKLNKTKDTGGKSGGDANGKPNHNVVIESHVDSNHLSTADDKTHAKTVVGGKTNRANSIDNNGNSDDVCMSAVAKKVVKKKVIIKKKVLKKKESDKQQPEPQLQQQQQQQPPVKSKRTKEPSGKKKPPTLSSPKPLASSPSKPKKKGAKTEAAASASASAVVTPFIRASFGKTFISPAQVSSVKSKFEKAKPKVKRETPPPPPRPPPEDSSSSEDESDDDDDVSSLDSSDSETSSGSSSSYYDSDDYGDKRIACSVSSFDSGLPSSPVPAPDPIGRKTTTTTLTTNRGPTGAVYPIQNVVPSCSIDVCVFTIFFGWRLFLNIA